MNFMKLTEIRELSEEEGKSILKDEEVLTDIMKNSKKAIALLEVLDEYHVTITVDGESHELVRPMTDPPTNLFNLTPQKEG
jgi:predicted nucleotidyltransferase